ncbi:DNRLRE domain-containing protein [Moorena sp. SIO4G3]|uniref:CBM96 family carbohydrate-binding protein n=1 Tax=Moorena sp. SIO4G3 TaxID=2607821 RepID=UPI00142AE67E|nr:DNRLRE domain-containing protein [Moorena sp. SIO4G3]NEO82165.1 DNRLRE domain-containing protein [Moorena sp. SIO4G3]
MILLPLRSQALFHPKSQRIRIVDKPQVASITGNVQVITTAAGNGADTFIRGGAHSSKNNGTNGQLVVKLDQNSSYNRKTYLRFDLSELNHGIDDVSLNLTTVNLHNTKGSIEFYGLNDGVDENWSETKTTWNNAPANQTYSPNLFISNQTTYLGKLRAASLAIGDSFSFNSPELLDFIKRDTDGLVTILVNRAEYKSPDSYITFASKESTEYSPPTLIATLRADS